MDTTKLDAIIEQHEKDLEIKENLIGLKNLLISKNQDNNKIKEIIEEIEISNPLVFEELKKSGIALFFFNFGKASIKTIKGYLFEQLVNLLVEKSGFELDFKSNQLRKTTKLKKLKGRGSTHQIDVLGKFKFSIPFCFNFILVGECKALKGSVSIKEARNFLGVVQDVREYVHVDLKEGGSKRYKAILEDQFRISPAFFSLKGFAKQAEEFLICHEIFPISYENNKIIKNIIDEIESLAEEKSEEIEEFMKEGKNYIKEKRENRDIHLVRIQEKINKLYSYFGFLNGNILVNIISDTKLDRFNLIRLKQEENILTSLPIQDKEEKIEISFSFSSNYLKFFEKEGIKFDKVNILFVEDNNFFMKELKIRIEE